MEEHKREGRIDPNYNCTFVNMYLETEYSHNGAHINRRLERIIPHWACPYWQEGRKTGLYSKVQATINEKGKYDEL